MKYKDFLIGVYAQLLFVLFQNVTRFIFAIIIIIEAREASLPRPQPRPSRLAGSGKNPAKNTIFF